MTVAFGFFHLVCFSVRFFFLPSMCVGRAKVKEYRMSLTSWLGRTFCTQPAKCFRRKQQQQQREEEVGGGGTKSFLKDGHELFTASDKRGAQRDTGRRIETDGNRRLFYHSNHDTDAAEIHPPAPRGSLTLNGLSSSAKLPRSKRNICIQTNQTFTRDSLEINHDFATLVKKKNGRF